MPNKRMRVCGLAGGQPAIVLAIALAGFGSAEASVVSASPTLPPDTGAHVGINGGAGCFPTFGVCAAAGTFYGFSPISSTFDAAGQELLFNATFTTIVTNLSNVPIGTIAFTGEFGETVFGRTSPDETGS
jgi:hypothetical protein